MNRYEWTVTGMKSEPEGDWVLQSEVADARREALEEATRVVGGYIGTEPIIDAIRALANQDEKEGQ